MLIEMIRFAITTKTACEAKTVVCTVELVFNINFGPDSELAGSYTSTTCKLSDEL